MLAACFEVVRREDLTLAIGGAINAANTSTRES
jgi:hypothetical protein